MNTLTLKEGLLRMLDGEKITIMVPQDLGTTWMDDLLEFRKIGAFCVRTEELQGGPAESGKQKEAYPDNDGGSYSMEHGKVEKEPEPEKQKKPKVDTGKIKALADAGWSAQKIAEEMGLSAPTIRRYLKEAES